MTRVLSFFVLLLALVALSAPSAALGMGVTRPVLVQASVQETVSAPIKVMGCKSLGGKRVMPCHPDLGVLTRTGPLAIRQAAPSLAMPRLVAPSFVRVPEAELPPPRAA